MSPLRPSPVVPLHYNLELRHNVSYQSTAVRSDMQQFRSQIRILRPELIYELQNHVFSSSCVLKVLLALVVVIICFVHERVERRDSACVSNLSNIDMPFNRTQELWRCLSFLPRGRAPERQLCTDRYASCQQNRKRSISHSGGGTIYPDHLA